MEKSARSAAAIAGGFALVVTRWWREWSSAISTKENNHCCHSCNCFQTLQREKVFWQHRFRKTKALTQSLRGIQGCHRIKYELQVTALKFAIASVGLLHVTATRFTKKTKSTQMQRTRLLNLLETWLMLLMGYGIREMKKRLMRL